jgi:trigger factor
MKIKLDKTENRMVYLTVEASPIDLETYMEKAYKRLTKRTDVPGFSRGEATLKALENQIGKDKMLEKVIEEIAQGAYSQAINEYKIETEMQPLVKTVIKDPPVLEMVIPLKPVVKLCDYHSLKIEPESLDIKEEEVNVVLEGLRKHYTKLNPVDRPVREDDGVVIDIKGEINGISFINKQGIKFTITPEHSVELPGLYKELIGMSKGEEKEFKLRFPESYARKEAAGQEADYRVKVNEILEAVSPEINDELAERIAPGVGKLEVLKDRIRVNMRREREANIKPGFEYRLMDTLIRESKIEYPQVMLDMQIDGLIVQHKQEINASCRDDTEYNERLKETPDNVLREKARLLAEKRIQWSLIINEAAKIEGIDVSDSEVDEEIKRIISGVGEEEKDEQWASFNDYQNRQDVEDLIKARKTINRLTEIVRS